jgi:protein-S-isoprenylcysteine O-methyltransferase Ste14
MAGDGNGRKARAVLGSILFFVIAPGTVAGWIPRAISGWRFEPPFFGLHATRVVGSVFIAAGTAGLVACFVRFALQGLGTPAPVAPPTRLVVTGLYRHVRNPMYVAVIAVVIGEALLLGSRALLWYAAIVWVFFHAWVLVYEEPSLRRRFGESYREYCANVGRWIPRLTPWLR